MRYLLLFILSHFSFSLSAQNSAISEADSLIALKKYETAFSVLDKADPDNSIPEIAIKKNQIALDYFATSLNHRMFALTDLEPHQDIMDVRGSNGSFVMHTFDPSEVLPALIEKHQDHFALYAALGYYYHELYTKYGSYSEKSEAEILDLMYENCLKAANGGFVDANNYYNLGFYLTMQNDYAPAIPWFEKSLAIDSTHITCNYNLAVSYYLSEQPLKALPFAKKATQLYQDPALKSDAARVTALIFKSQEQHHKALEYYILANEIDPGNYYNLNQLLEQQLLMNLEKDAGSTANEFYELAPTNPRICSDLVEIYLSAEKGKLLELFFLTRTKMTSDDEELGNLYFHLGQMNLGLENEKDAKTYFKTAKKHFKKVFESDHYVFTVIDDVLKE